MKKRTQPATLDNVIRLFSLRIKEFKGESRRSYQKAFSSFQLYVLKNYRMSSLLSVDVVRNWIADNIVNGLSRSTVSFYLDKISSLYSGVAFKMEGGKLPIFKEAKAGFKDIIFSNLISKKITGCFEALRRHWERNEASGKVSLLSEAVLDFSGSHDSEEHKAVRYIRGCVALHAGVEGEIVRNLIRNCPAELSFLNMFGVRSLTDNERQEALRKVILSLEGEAPQWFVMRLRPRVKFDDILTRFSLISNEVKMPELFYPAQEIARRIGRKVVWKEKPVIRDVVFFQKRKGEVYKMFTLLYDLAWCYRNPGKTPGNYAAIPDTAMENFKEALGLLTPDFEVAPAGEMELRPGDKVVIVNGDYRDEKGMILKKPSLDEDGNKVYRVTLLDSNGRWDIGIDARLLKKV